MELILRIHAARGFPGMVGSIDYQQYEWKNCPTSLSCTYKRKDKKRKIVLEGVADGEGWFWFMCFWIPGSLRDIHVIDNSPTMGIIMSGSFPL